MSDEQEKDKLDLVTAATFEWGSFFSTPIGKVLAGVIVSLLMLAASWITDRTKPVPAPVPVPVSPPVINVIPGPSTDPINPIVEPPTINGKIVLHLIASAKDVPASELLKGLTFQTDPKVYRDGATYPFAGKSIPLPCMSRWSDGKVVDVQPFTKAEEVVAFVKKGVAP